MKKFKRLIASTLVLLVTMLSVPPEIIARATETTEDVPKVETQQNNPKKKVPKIIKEVIEKREQNVKQFMLEDNTYLAVTYQQPVHFLENGQWKDIDNTLVIDTDPTFVELENSSAENTNQDSTIQNTSITETPSETKEKNIFKSKENQYKVKFAKNTNSNKLVKIEKGNYNISWNIEGAQLSEHQIVQKDFSKIFQEIESEVDKRLETDGQFKNFNDAEKSEARTTLIENEKKKLLANVSSAIEYKEVFPAVDVNYTTSGESLKENIILNSYKENFQITFNISTNDLIAKLEADKSIGLYDKNDSTKLIFKMAAPFMYDSKGEVSSNITLDLKQVQNGYTLALTPDNNWLSSAERAFPVNIDPPIETPNTVNSIQDSFVCSIDTDNKYLSPYLMVGDKGTMGTARTYIKFDLPELSSSSMVTSSVLALWSIGGTSGTQVNAHKVNAGWSSSTITWSNKPAYETKIEEYKKIGSAASWYYFDITSIAKDWYTKDINNGLMLKADAESSGSGSATFLSSDYTQENNAAGRPVVSIYYTDYAGLEGYWSYHSQDVGRAGTGYINDYNGNLIFVHNDLSMNGNRMPVTINHVYNSTHRKQSIGYGNGWRLNFSQRVGLDSLSGKYYYIDEDGTTHYFKSDVNGILKDESGIELTLTKNASDGSYTITDKKHNNMYFTSAGYLWRIIDSNNNKLTLTYSGPNIKTITDEVGRITTLDVLTNGYLVGIIDPSGRRTSFSYTGTQLTKVTYPDGKITVYNYDTDNKLTSAVNYDGYKISYTYTTGSLNRVQTAAESNIDGTLGNTLTVNYGFNATKFTTIGSNSTTKTMYYQFNDNGNTVSVRDSDYNAKYYKYGKQDTVNKLTEESKLQKSVPNYLLNHNAEFDNAWSLSSWMPDNDSTASMTSEDKYLGTRSFKVTKTTEVSRDFYKQNVTYLEGKTYTLSAYVKTNAVSSSIGNGAAIFVYYKDAAGNDVTVQSEYITGTTGWQRIEKTFTLPSNFIKSSLYIGLGIVGGTGTALFDCVQLEDGWVANKYNLVENGDFRNGYRGYWTEVNLDTTDAITNVTAPALIDTNGFKIYGKSTVSKNINQQINISGAAGDIFIVSGWAKGESVPINNNAEGRYFALDVGLVRNDNTVQWCVVPFNEDTTDWQYVSDAIKADAAYKAVRVYALYYNNENSVSFDGFRLYKEEYGTSYAYDAKGNLTTSDDVAKQKSTFQYSANNDLTKLVNPMGYEFSYEYDNNDSTKKNHNLTKATTAENVVYSFTYDSAGNPLTSKVGGSTLFMQSSATYTTNGNYISSLTDSDGNVVKYSYDDLKGTLDNVTDPKGKITSYGYDPNTDNLINVSKSADGRTITNSYTYEKDRLKSITHNGFMYDFEYDSLGNNKKVSVGGQSLITNSFEARTSKLLESLYGNGQKISNGYDSLNRVIDKKYNGSILYKYEYDARGNVGYHEDLENKVNYRYEYDLADRPVQTRDSLGNTLSFDYDLNSNVSKFTELLQGTDYVKSFITNFTYDKDNRPKTTTYARDGVTSTKEYVYDSIGRVTNSKLSVGASTNIFNTNYAYKDVLGGGTTTKVKEIDNNGKKISYTYDSNGNIDTIIESGKIIKYYYNELNELLREDNGVLDKTITYLYDDGGNIKSRTEYKYNNGTLGTIPNNAFSDGSFEEGTTKVRSYSAKNAIVGQAPNLSARTGSKSFFVDGNSGATFAFLSTVTPVIPGRKYSISFYHREATTGSFTGNASSLWLGDSNYVDLGLSFTADQQWRKKEFIWTAPVNTTATNMQLRFGFYSTTYSWLQVDDIQIVEIIDAATAAPTNTYSYEYIDNVWKDKLTSFNGKAITYDTIGNPLTYNGYTYAWKQGRQLAGISGNGLSTSYLYNDAGIRTQKTSGGVVTSYHLVGDKVTYEESGTDRLYYTYDSAGKLVSMNLSEKYNIIGGASSDIGLFENATSSGVSLVDAAIPQTTTTARAIRLNANASIPAITSSALYLKANTNYTLEFDYWSDADGKQFKTDLFPDDLPQSTVTANKAVQHFKWTLNSSSTNMAIAKLRFFNDIINPNPSNIYITNIKLYEVNNTKVQSNEYYYIRNAQGDIIGIIDKAGTQVVSYTYDSWGQLVSISGRMAGSVGIKNPYRYRGYRYDTETKLYYLQSRYYSPEWGRFVNADALIGVTGELLGHNIYVYCKNNPINMCDPTGFRALSGFEDEETEPEYRRSIWQGVISDDKNLDSKSLFGGRSSTFLGWDSRQYLGTVYAKKVGFGGEIGIAAYEQSDNLFNSGIDYSGSLFKASAKASIGIDIANDGKISAAIGASVSGGNVQASKSFSVFGLKVTVGGQLDILAAGVGAAGQISSKGFSFSGRYSVLYGGGFNIGVSWD